MTIHYHSLSYTIVPINVHFVHAHTLCPHTTHWRHSPTHPQPLALISISVIWTYLFNKSWSIKQGHLLGVCCSQKCVCYWHIQNFNQWGHWSFKCICKVTIIQAGKDPHLNQAAHSPSQCFSIDSGLSELLVLSKTVHVSCFYLKIRSIAPLLHLGWWSRGPEKDQNQL